jgi:hypothetical protein
MAQISATSRLQACMTETYWPDVGDAGSAINIAKTRQVLSTADLRSLDRVANRRKVILKANYNALIDYGEPAGAEDASIQWCNFASDGGHSW